MKKWVKILLWIVGVLLGLVFLATLLVSPIAKNYVNKHGEELVGRKVQVEGLRINVYTGHLAVHGLNLYEDNGTDVFASFDTLDVKASLLKLLSHTVQLKHITLSGLKVNVIQEKETFNFQSIIDHFASDTTEAETDTTPSDWVMKFYNIRLSHAQLHYQDRTNGKQWHLPDVNLRVPGFVLGGEEASEGGLNIGFAEGGHLNIDGNYDAQKNDYNLTANLSGFTLKNIEPLMADFVKFKSMKGTLAATLKAQGNIDEIMKSRIGGTLTLKNADLSNEGGSVASLNTLNVNIKNINLDANSYDIQSVMLDGLTAKYEQWKERSTVDDILVPVAETQPAEASEESETGKEAQQAMSLRIGQLTVTNSNLTYDDHTLPDEFHFPVTNINVEATDLTLNGDNNAKLRATLPGGGHLMMKWNGNIDNWKAHQDLFLSIKGLDMKKLGPWSVAYTGQPIEDGVFGLTTRLNIRNSQLDNKNKIDIYNARVGSRRKDVDPEVKIPLKTALYILRDKDDKILIDLPISGNVDSPEFSYMKLVWKTLGNLLVKVATSPVRALGNALGMGSDNLDFMAIDPYQRGLTSENYHTLGDLAAIAKSDSLVLITLVQRMPQPTNDTMARGYEFRNEIVRRYLQEQGVSGSQISVTTGEPVTGDEKTGYSITSEMKME